MEAINKAFEILELFLKTDQELSIYEVASLTGIKPSSAYRITYILIERGYIVQPHKRGKYSLSPNKIAVLSGLARRKLNVRNIALPCLQELSKATDESANMALCLGKVVFDSDIINTNHRWNIKSNTTTFSLYSNSVGKIFLAYMSENKMQEYFDSVELIPRTPNTITNRDDLKIQLETIKRDGVAFDYEEEELGLRGVAAPVWDTDRNIIAAIGIFGPSVRITRTKMVTVAPIVKKYALEISIAMGYRP